MKFQAKKDILRNAVITSIDSNKKIQELKSKGKKDEEITLCFFFTATNKNSALLGNLVLYTGYKIRVYYCDDNIAKFRNNFLVTYKNHNFNFIKIASEADFIGLASNFDAIIFDEFFFEKKPNFIFPYLEIKDEILPTIIISNTPLTLINFDEIYKNNKEVIDEIKKEERQKYQIDYLLDSKPQNNLPFIYRYLLSQGNVKQCEFIIENYCDKLDRDLVIFTIIEVIYLDERNDNLIGLCIKNIKLSDEEINLLLQSYVWYNFNKIDYKKLDYFYKKFIEKIDDTTREMLLQFARSNHELIDFLVCDFGCDINKLLNYLIAQKSYKTLDYVLEKYRDKIALKALNSALREANKFEQKDVIAKLIAYGANESLIKADKKNYGWSKFLEDDNLFNDVVKEGVDWLKSSFDSYHAVMNDFLFNINYGYYSSAFVKIGGNASDYTTNVTNSKAFAFLLTLLAIKKWEKAGRPHKFVVLELCGGNGKLANDILTISELLSQNILEIKDFYKALNHRTVDISDGLSKIQQKRNEKFIKEGKFKVVLSDVTDEKWLEKFDLKDEKGFIFANELVDQFIPNPLIVKNGDKAFEEQVVSYVLVDSFERFCELFPSASSLSAEAFKDGELRKLYDELLTKSKKYKENFAKYFAIKCVDNDLIVGSKDFREKIIPLILKPRIDQAKSMRHEIFNLEEEQEEYCRKNEKRNAEILNIKINSLVKNIDKLAEEMTDIWRHFLFAFLPLPRMDYKVSARNLKYLTSYHLYPKNYAIHYDEDQLEKLLEITSQLKNYDEFFCFEYGALELREEEKCRDVGYYAFSYLIKDSVPNDPLQNRFDNNQNKVGDVFAKLFLGIDITIDLNFPKARVIAEEKGWKHVGLYCHQREFDGFLKEIDLNLYQEALKIMKLFEYCDIEDDVRKFRNIGETFKVMSLRK